MTTPNPYPPEDEELEETDDDDDEEESEEELPETDSPQVAKKRVSRPKRPKKATTKRPTKASKKVAKKRAKKAVKRKTPKATKAAPKARKAKMKRAPGVIKAPGPGPGRGRRADGKPRRKPGTNPPRNEVAAAFGRKVAKARNAKEWTQADLAKKLDMSQPGIANIERGISGGSKVVKAKIAKVLGL